jgi:hypothetical protein
MTKKRKPLDSAMSAFVFGEAEAERTPQTPTVAPPAASATREVATSPAPQTPTVAPPVPEILAPESLPLQSKESSLTHRLQAPDKEATVRFTVDMSESLHRKLSMLAARTGRKKVDIVRMLLEDGLKEVEA